jgi:hypothetical protein
MILDTWDPKRGHKKILPERPNAIAFDQSILNLLPLSQNIQFVKTDIERLPLYCASPAAEIYSHGYALRVLQNRNIDWIRRVTEDKYFEKAIDPTIDFPTMIEYDGPQLKVWADENCGNMPSDIYNEMYLTDRAQTEADIGTNIFGDEDTLYSRPNNESED